MAPLLLKDGERLDALKKYCEGMRASVEKKEDDDAAVDAAVLVNNLAGALKVYGVPLGKPDPDSAKALLESLKTVWDSYARATLDRCVMLLISNLHCVVQSFFFFSLRFEYQCFVHA